MGERVLHGAVEVRAHPSLVRFHEVIRLVCGRLPPCKRLHRLILSSVLPLLRWHGSLVSFGVVIRLVLLCSLVLVHQVGRRPRVPANGGGAFLDVGVALALGPFSVSVRSDVRIPFRNRYPWLLFLLFLRSFLILCVVLILVVPEFGSLCLRVVGAGCSFPYLRCFVLQLQVKLWIGAGRVFRIDELVLVALDLLDGLLGVEPDSIRVLLRR